jgi:hypothetical protein
MSLRGPRPVFSAGKLGTEQVVECSCVLFIRTSEGKGWKHTVSLEPQSIGGLQPSCTRQVLSPPRTGPHTLPDSRPWSISPMALIRSWKCYLIMHLGHCLFI